MERTSNMNEFLKLIDTYQILLDEIKSGKYIDQIFNCNFMNFKTGFGNQSSCSLCVTAKIITGVIEPEFFNYFCHACEWLQKTNARCCDYSNELTYIKIMTADSFDELATALENRIIRMKEILNSSYTGNYTIHKQGNHNAEKVSGAKRNTEDSLILKWNDKKEE